MYQRRLRTKIDEGYALALIKTVRGFRYRLDAMADSAAQTRLRHAIAAGTARRAIYCSGG